MSSVASGDWKQMNLSFAYELPLYASLLTPCLSGVASSEEGHAEARRLLDMLAPFRHLPLSCVPAHSPTRRFAGGAWIA